MGGGSKMGTEVPKNPAPAAAVTGVLRLSSILSKILSEERRDFGSSLSRDPVVSDDGGLNESLLSCGDGGGDVAVGGEKHRRLSDTQGRTRAFFRSGMSGLDPGLGKWHSVNTGSSIILILVVDDFSCSVLDEDSDSAEEREMVSTGVTGELSDDNGLSTV